MEYKSEKEPLPPINGTHYANGETSSRGTSSDKDGDDKKKEKENVVGFFELDKKELTNHSNMSSVEMAKLMDEEITDMNNDTSGKPGHKKDEKQNTNENKTKNGSLPYKKNAVEPLKEKDGLRNGSNGVFLSSIPSKEKDQSSEMTEKDEKEKSEKNEQVAGFFELFKYSKKKDVLCMIIGTLSAMIHGSAFPLMIIVFGEMIDIFVISGEYALVVDYLQSLGILASLGYTEDQVTKDPELLKPHYATILTQSNNTVNTGTIDKAIDNDLLELMRRYAIYYIAIGGGVIVLGYLQVTMWMIASERQTHRIRKLFYKNILRQNIGWFDTQESGELNTRISGDISTIHDGIGDKCGSFCQWISGAIIGVVIGFVYGWELTLVTIAVSPFLVGAAAVTTKLVAMASGAELKAYATAGAIAEEVLGAIRTVVAFGGQEKESERYEKQLTHARDMGIRKGMINGVALGSVWLIIMVTYGFGFWYGAKKIREDPDDYTIGNVCLVFFAVVIAAFSLGNASPAIQSIGKARGAAYKVYQLIEQVPPIDSFSEEGMQPERFNGSVELQNVHFTYPSRPDVKILKGVNLKIERGQTVALVGASGCGKSTVVQLIQRFYDAEEGQVLIDGIDMRDINVKWLRQHIGIVSQEPILFGTTIAENIRYGGDDVTDEMITEATKMANAYDFIMELPDKFETLVGERGAQLSGGQKQRIAIARALVRDPKILLLDEATSALDTESEGIVQEALEKASHGRTTIVIAHRLSTIKSADVIAGFKDGVIVEKGTHDQLMKQGGIYYQLVTLQTKTTDEEADIEAEMYSGQKPALKKQISKHIPEHDVSDTKSVDGDDKEGKDKKKEEDNAGLGRVMKMNAPEWYIIALGCFGSLINGGVMPSFAIIFAEMLGVFSESDPDKQEEEVRFWVLMFVLIGCVSFCTYFLQGAMFGRSGEHLTLRLRSLSFKAILRQDIAYFDDHSNSVGALTTRLATDAAQVQGAAGARIGQSIMSLSSITAGLVIAFVYSWKMTLVILGFVPFLVAGGFLQMTMLQGAAGKNKEALEAAGKVAVESIENIRTVASLTKEPKFIENFLHELQEPYKSAMKKAHVVGIAFSFSQGVMFFTYAACFYFGAYLISENELDYVEVFRVFSALVFSAMSVGEASSFAPDAAKAQASAIEIFKLLDREPAIDSYSKDGEKPTEGSYTAAITFKAIKFRYPTRKDVTVLNGLNITVSPGQTVALVGSSGCGKSTTVQLIERFYDPEDGDVFLDSHKMTDLNIGWLRSQIGIVSQEPILFDRSIAENIAYGDNSRNVPMDEVIAAARSANIHSFISSLPDGYETNVGEKGAQLSGGQKQRVAIARALLRNPKILLLDEATSALDTESEKVVQEALDKAREGRTSIVIAHRLSTIQNADKIYVIRKGVVTEEGTHSQLMSHQGFYYKLNQAQGRKN